jgi:serine protease SohB
VKTPKKGGRNFREDLNETHHCSKILHQMRPQLDIEQVATGEHWYGSRRWKKGWWMRSEPATMLLGLMESHEVMACYQQQRKLSTALPVARRSADRLLLRWWQRGQNR